MKLPTEIVSNIYKIFKEKGVQDEISGDIYLSGNRPLNSDKNDIVLGVLSVPNRPLNNTLVLINIFVKNINSKPHYAELDRLTKTIVPLFGDKFYADFQMDTDIEKIEIYKIDSADEYACAIRVKISIIG